MSDFKAKMMHQIRIPQTHWGSLQCSPQPLAVFQGPTSKGMAGKGRGGRKSKGEGRGEVEGIWLTQKFCHGAPYVADVYHHYCHRFISPILSRLRYTNLTIITNVPLLMMPIMYPPSWLLSMFSLQLIVSNCGICMYVCMILYMRRCSIWYQASVTMRHRSPIVYWVIDWRLLVCVNC